MCDMQSRHPHCLLWHCGSGVLGNAAHGLSIPLPSSAKISGADLRLEIDDAKGGGGTHIFCCCQAFGNGIWRVRFASLGYMHAVGPMPIKHCKKAPAWLAPKHIWLHEEVILILLLEGAKSNVGEA